MRAGHFEPSLLIRFNASNQCIESNLSQIMNALLDCNQLSDQSAHHPQPAREQISRELVYAPKVSLDPQLSDLSSLSSPASRWNRPSVMIGACKSPSMLNGQNNFTFQIQCPSDQIVE